MNDRQKAFADEYILTLNGRESYKKAYKNVTKDTTADVNASKLLRNPKVKAYIGQRMAQMDKQKVASQEEVLEYFTKVMRGQTVEEVVQVVGTGDGYSEVVKVTKIPSEKERLKAAELLGKRYALFTDKQELSGGVNIVFTGEDEMED